MATGDGSIQSRLAGAALYLIRLRPEDLPEELRHEFESVSYERKRKTLGVEDNMRKLTSEEGTRLADRILSLYTKLSLTAGFD